MSEFEWQLQENETKLLLTLNKAHFSANDSSAISFDILEITDAKLVLKSVQNDAYRVSTTIETYKNVR